MVHKQGRKVFTLQTRPPDTTEQHAAMTWAQRLKRLFGIDMQSGECGGAIKVIACIEAPVVIKQILDHLDDRETKNRQALNHKQHTTRALLTEEINAEVFDTAQAVGCAVPVVLEKAAKALFSDKRVENFRGLLRNLDHVLVI